MTRNNHIYLLFICFMTHGLLMSQGVHFHDGPGPNELRYDRYELGAEVGPSMTTFWTNSPYATYGLDCHYSAGIFFRYNVKHWVGFQTGINIEKVGSRTNFQWTDVNGNPIGDAYLKLQNDYLTFPLLVRFNAINKKAINKKVILNFTIGGFCSYLIYAKDIISPYPPGTPNDPNPGKETITNRTDQLHRFNGGITAGIGLDYRFKFIPLKLGFEVRNNLGLFHIVNNDPSSNFLLRTNSLQFLFRVSWI